MLNNYAKTNKAQLTIQIWDPVTSVLTSFLCHNPLPDL